MLAPSSGAPLCASPRGVVKPEADTAAKVLRAMGVGRKSPQRRGVRPHRGPVSLQLSLAAGSAAARAAWGRSSGCGRLSPPAWVRGRGLHALDEGAEVALVVAALAQREQHREGAGRRQPPHRPLGAEAQVAGGLLRAQQTRLRSGQLGGGCPTGSGRVRWNWPTHATMFVRRSDRCPPRPASVAPAEMAPGVLLMGAAEDEPPRAPFPTGRGALSSAAASVSMTRQGAA